MFGQSGAQATAAPGALVVGEEVGCCAEVGVGEGCYAGEHCVVFCGSEVNYSLRVGLRVVCVVYYWGGEGPVAGLGGEG